MDTAPAGTRGRTRVTVLPASASRADELFARLDAELARRYADARPWRPDQLAQAAVRRVSRLAVRPDERRRHAVIVAESGGEAVGCAVLFDDGDDDCVELGRMYVVVERRGEGIADALLDRAEQEAAALGARRIRLETGRAQPEAAAVYARHGYRPIRRWGRYRGNLASRCYEKHL